MRLVLPGQEALEVLERAGTTKDQCTMALEQIFAEERIQLSVFKKLVPIDKIDISDDPRQQGSFSFTYYVAIEQKRFVAQFREGGAECTSLKLLETAAGIFGHYVAKPLFITMYGTLQVVIWEYYGESFQMRFRYGNFTHVQKMNAMRQYAMFLAVGCREGCPQNLMNSKVYENFQKIAGWSLPPSLSKAISILNSRLGIYFRVHN